MSRQDSEKCVKCGVESGYEESRGAWEDWDSPEYLGLCGRCKRNMISKFTAFFGLENIASDRNGIEIQWREVDKILSKIQRDLSRRTSYIVTDKDFYERTKTEEVSILDSN